jgi:hypothetical protein
MMKMRYGWSCCLLLLLHFQLMGQAFQNITVPLITGQSFPLSSRGIGFFNGEHALVLEIDLPDNTLEWHYRFYCFLQEEPLEKATARLSLEADLMKHLLNPGSIKLTAAPLVAEEAQSKANIFLLKDSSEVPIFNSRISLSGLNYHQKSSASGNAAWVRITEPAFLKGKQYLAISNAQALQSSILYLEAVAITRAPKVALNGWTQPELEDWYAEIVDICATQADTTLHPSQFAAVAGCFRAGLEEHISAVRFKEMSDVEQQQWKTWLYSQCKSKSSGKGKSVNYQDVDAYLLTGSWKSEKGELLRFNYNGYATLRKNNGQLLDGTWEITDGILSLNFRNHRKQEYRSNAISRNFISWENNRTGNYLRLYRLTP